MFLFITDKILGNENYQCSVWINGRQSTNIKQIKKNQIKVPCSGDCEIKVEYKNIFFEEKYAAYLCFLYWILAIVSGTAEPNPFGKPFNYVICISVFKDENIYLTTNPLWKKTAFEVSGDCKILKNSLDSPRGYKKKWFWGFAFPVAILIFIIFLILIMIDVMANNLAFKTIILAIPMIIELFWLIYVIKIMRLCP